jgi:hypothetical protein
MTEQTQVPSKAGWICGNCDKIHFHCRYYRMEVQLFDCVAKDHFECFKDGMEFGMELPYNCLQNAFQHRRFKYLEYFYETYDEKKRDELFKQFSPYFDLTQVFFQACGDETKHESETDDEFKARLAFRSYLEKKLPKELPKIEEKYSHQIKFMRVPY